VLFQVYSIVKSISYSKSKVHLFYPEYKNMFYPSRICSTFGSKARVESRVDFCYPYPYPYSGGMVLPMESLLPSKVLTIVKYNFTLICYVSFRSCLAEVIIFLDLSIQV